MITQAVSPGDIFKLGHDNDILADCITAWKNGVFTWEGAMQTAVSCLLKENADLKQKFLDIELQSPEDLL